MGLADFMKDTFGNWSGHKAPTGEQTNPNNDPEIAASQERLRVLGQFNFKATPPSSLGSWQSAQRATSASGESTEEVWVRTVTWDTPGGKMTGQELVAPPPQTDYSQMPTAIPKPPDSQPVNLSGLQLRSTDKYWWKPGLAEPFYANVDPASGALTNVSPKDTRHSLGEKAVDAVGNFAGVAAFMLASYGLGQGLGAASTAVQAGAAPAAGATTLTPAEIAAINSAGVIESGSVAAGLMPGATFETAAAATAAGAAPAAAGGAPAAAGGAPISAATPTWVNPNTATPSFWNSAGNLGSALMRSGGTGGFWSQVLAAGVAGVGQGILDENKRDNDREDTDNKRAYEARNLNPQNVPRINWNVVRVPEEPKAALPQPMNAQEAMANAGQAMGANAPVRPGTQPAAPPTAGILQSQSKAFNAVPAPIDNRLVTKPIIAGAYY